MDTKTAPPLEDQQIPASPEIPRRRGKAQASLDLIDAAYDILEEIQPASVRAVCYRLFTAGYLTSMSKAETNRAGGHILDAREAGTIPWEWIVDHTRSVRGAPSWDDPAEFIDCAIQQYRKDYWRLQPIRLEVWCEKATVISTIDPVLKKYGVKSRMMTGFGGATAVRNAAEFAVDASKPCVALYIGDWDPSGLYMSRVDLPKRLGRYACNLKDEVWIDLDKLHDYYSPWEIQRVALTEMDIRAGDVPSFSSTDKMGDPRYQWYRDAAYSRGPRNDDWGGVWDDEWDGAQCWEVDALSPVMLRDRVETMIQLRIDDAAWERCVRSEVVERQSLEMVLGAWNGISDTMLLDAVRS